MKVFLSRKAKKALENSPLVLKTRLESKISELEKTAYPSGCKKLRGAPNCYRLRVGDHRILYVILGRDETLVFKVTPRESTYD